MIRNYVINFSNIFICVNSESNLFILEIMTNIVTGGQVVYGKALDIMIELLKTTKEEEVLIALLSWFKTISELEDEREVNDIIIVYNYIFIVIMLKKKCIISHFNILNMHICITFYLDSKITIIIKKKITHNLRFCGNAFNYLILKVIFFQLNLCFYCIL